LQLTASTWPTVKALLKQINNYEIFSGRRHADYTGIMHHEKSGLH